MSHKPSTSFGVLPWEVVADEVLLRLPLKSLAKFKSVSKLWYSHISTPHLAGNLNPVFRCRTKTGGDFVYYVLRGNKLNMIKLEDAPTSSKYLRPIGSCDGITCFVTDLASSMILWNPSIEQHSGNIPMPNHRNPPSEVAVGFGHDSRTDEYKVVYFDYRRTGSSPSAEVYSLKDQMWKNVTSSTGQLLPDHVSIVEMTWWPQGSADGRMIHWLAKCEDGRNLAAKKRRRMIVSFDMCDEAFGLMDLPQCLADVDYGLDFQRVELATLPGNDLVTLFVYDKEWDSRTEYSVWVMKKYGVADSWTEIKISLGESGRPLGYLDKRKFLFGLKSGKVLLYDTMTEEKEYIGIRDVHISACVGNYMESPIKFGYTPTSPISYCTSSDTRPIEQLVSDMILE